MTLYETLTAAINAISSQGYVSPEQVEYWLTRIRDAARGSLMPEPKLQAELERALRAKYAGYVEHGGILAQHTGLPRFTLEKVKPHLRAELDRRIVASANLIKLNRAQAIDKTLQRFSGWATSVPAGGTKNTDKVEEKTRIRSSMTSLPFEERRVLIDQGHKLAANLSDTLARDGGAIAGEWHSNWRQPGYNYRQDHKERDRLIYLLRTSWARERGLVKPGPPGCYEDITACAEEPFCRCRMRWIYQISALPADMLTQAGAAAQEAVRGALAARLRASG